MVDLHILNIKQLSNRTLHTPNFPKANIDITPVSNPKYSPCDNARLLGLIHCYISVSVVLRVVHHPNNIWSKGNG